MINEKLRRIALVKGFTIEEYDDLKQARLSASTRDYSMVLTIAALVEEGFYISLWADSPDYTPFGLHLFADKVTDLDIACDVAIRKLAPFDFSDCRQEAIKFTVNTQPQAQPRHRHRLIGNRTIVYDPAKRDKENFLKAAKQYKPDTPLSGPIRLHISVVFGRPKCHYGTGKNANTLKPRAPYWNTNKPDFDNISKFYTDALNGVFFKDDRQICSFSFDKSYGAEGSVTIEMCYIEE